MTGLTGRPLTPWQLPPERVLGTQPQQEIPTFASEVHAQISPSVQADLPLLHQNRRRRRQQQWTILERRTMSSPNPTRAWIPTGRTCTSPTSSCRSFTSSSSLEPDHCCEPSPMQWASHWRKYANYLYVAARQTLHPENGLARRGQVPWHRNHVYPTLE